MIFSGVAPRSFPAPTLAKSYAGVYGDSVGGTEELPSAHAGLQAVAVVVGYQYWRCGTIDDRPEKLLQFFGPFSANQRLWHG
jgi:hypothetical protein